MLHALPWGAEGFKSARDVLCGTLGLREARDRRRDQQRVHYVLDTTRDELETVSGRWKASLADPDRQAQPERRGSKPSERNNVEGSSVVGYNPSPRGGVIS